MASSKDAKTTICESAIVAMAFSPDGKQVAFCPNNHLIHIADVTGPKCADWKIVHTLKQHQQVVSSIEWHPKTGKIISCSFDRTAFVWGQETPESEWKPSMVLLDANMKRGFTAAGFSASGKKIYVGCAANNFAIGRYAAESDWWECVLFTVHNAAITALAPHTTADHILATGGADYQVKITSTFMPSVDGKANPWPKRGTEMGAFQLSGWVNALTWSKDGNSLAVCTHDSRLTVLSGTSTTDFSTWTKKSVLLNGLPLRAAAFLSESALVVGGHDCFPMAFEKQADGNWKLSMRGVEVAALKKEQSLAASAREMFQNQARLGQTEAVEMPKTRHLNTIIGLAMLPAPLAPFSFATASLDGKIEFWKPDDMAAA